MKTTKKYLSLFLILAMIMSSITVFYINAAEILDETDIDVIETENVIIEHELVPVMANACNNYDYLNAGLTMDDIAQQNGWILVYYEGEYKHARIYENGIEIGRYDITSSYNQDPHFHLFGNEYNIHYWVAF